MSKKEIITLALIILIDQITKYLVVNFLSFKELVIIPHFFSLNLTYNKGGAFSIFNNQVIFIIIVSLGCLFLLNKIEKELANIKYKDICFGLLYGGIIGNLWDRIIYGEVRDFLDFSFGSYHYPTFNIADISIVIGVIWCLIVFLRQRGNKDEKNNSRN